MKRSLPLLVTVALFFAAWSCAQPAKPESTAPAALAAPIAPAENVEAVITKLEKDWAAAIVNKDTGALDRLLSDDFNGTSPTAHTYPKTWALDDLKSEKYSVSSMELDEVSVNVYGDTAVAFTSQEEKSSYGGKNTSGHYHFTDVWVRRNGQWQVVASHGSRFETGHEALTKK